MKTTLVDEWCPHCKGEQSFKWDISNDGYIAFCLVVAIL